MHHNQSSQDQISLISISIYLPLLIFFILLAISSDKSLQQHYNNSQMNYKVNQVNTNTLRDQQIYEARELLRLFFANYPIFSEYITNYKTNKFLVYKCNYQKILQTNITLPKSDMNIFFVQLFQKISILRNTKMEIVFPEQFSFYTLINFKNQIDKLLFEYNLPNNFYSIGISNKATDIINLSFKLDN